MASRPTRNTGATAASIGATAAAAAADMIDESELLNDSFLMNIAKQLELNYLEFGVFLGLKGNTVRHIMNDNRGAVSIHFSILETWRNGMNPRESVGVMYDKLREALREIGRTDIEEQVQQIQSSTSEAPKAASQLNTERQHDKEKIRRLTEEVEALKMKLPRKPTYEEHGARPKESERGNKQRVAKEKDARPKESEPGNKQAVKKAMTEDRIRILKATLSVEDEGKDEDGSKRRFLRVLSLLRQYGQAELWRHVSCDILKDGKLDVSGDMSSAQLTDLTFFLASGEATEVTSLILDGCSLSSEVSAALAVALGHLPRLTKLSLQDCQISAEGMETLATGIQTLTALTDLDLRFNDVSTPAAAERLALSLVSLKRLEDLRLVGCHIHDSGARQIVAAVNNSPSLRLLNLDFNHITDDGCRRLKEETRGRRGLIVGLIYQLPPSLAWDPACVRAGCGRWS